MRYRFTFVAAIVAVTTLSASVLHAQPYTPTQADMLQMTVGFGAGTIQSITPDGPGVLFNATLGDEGSFSRFVPQKANFNGDISAFTSFDVIMTSLSPAVGSTKLYIQTGGSFAFFESADVSLPTGVPTLVSLSLAGIPDTNNVRQYGWQIFGGPGTTPGVELRVHPIPEPALGSLAVLSMALLRRRRHA